MTEKERELRQRMAKVTEEIRTLMADKKLDEAESKTNELRELKRQLEIEQTLADVPAAVPPAARAAEITDEEKRDLMFSGLVKEIKRQMPTDAEAEVLKEARAGMKAGVDADGGLIVPQDISTKINELKRALNPLDQLVTITPTTTMTGSRVMEKWAEMTPLESVDEMATIKEIDGPKFEKIAYAIKKYAGILPISKEMLSDTDQNLISYVSAWFAKKDVVTRNSLIIAIMKTLAKKPVANVDSLKDILNVDLDPAISLVSGIVTNQDGFNFLDKLKDSEGRYLLQPNPLNPTQKLLFAHPVTVVSNKYLPTVTSPKKVAPIIVGSLADAIVLFDRQLITLEGTGIGGNSFIRDSYDIKAITRLDVKAFDSAAAVYGELTLA